MKILVSRELSSPRIPKNGLEAGAVFLNTADVCASGVYTHAEKIVDVNGQLHTEATIGEAVGLRATV